MKHRRPTRVTRLLVIVLSVAPIIACAQSEESRAEGYLREIVSMSESGADIHRLLNSRATRALVVGDRRASYLLTRFISGSGHRLAKATAIFALGEIRDEGSSYALEHIRQESSDPFLRDAADASLRKIYWWKSSSVSDSTVGSGTSVRSTEADQVPVEWKRAMRSPLTLSQTERLEIVKDTPLPPFNDWNDGFLGPREYAILSENWDVSRSVVLESISDASEDDPRVATELAVIAMRPTADLLADGGLQTVLRRFTASSYQSNRILALYGLIRIEDPQAMAVVAGMERDPKDRWIASLFHTLAADRREPKFADVLQSYSEAYLADTIPSMRWDDPEPDTSMRAGFARQETLTAGSSKEGVTLSTQDAVAGDGSPLSPPMHTPMHLAPAGGERQVPPNSAPDRLRKGECVWIALGLVLVYTLLAALLRRHRP